MSTRIRIGMLRLTDSAPIAVAKARRIFKSLSIDAALSIEPSWANIADKLAYGLLDAAAILPPLALSLDMGLRGPATKLVIPMGLSQGGNTVVLGGESRNVAAGMPPGARLLAWLAAQSKPPRIAVVHRFSTHNLLLRYWLALTGVDPDRDMEIVVVPPDQVVGALAGGQIAGFCAGAPWGAEAHRAGIGNVLLGTSDIWPFHPEKCFAVRQDWAFSNPEALTRVLRALMRAQAICDLPEETAGVAEILSDPEGLALPRAAAHAALPGSGMGMGAGVTKAGVTGAGVTRAGVTGAGAAGAGEREQILFHIAGAAYPAPPHGLWFLSQMRRWGWLDDTLDLPAAVTSVYRPDLYAQAARMEDLFAFSGLARNNANFQANVPLPGPTRADLEF